MVGREKVWISVCRRYSLISGGEKVNIGDNVEANVEGILRGEKSGIEY